MGEAGGRAKQRRGKQDREGRVGSAGAAVELGAAERVGRRGEARQPAGREGGRGQGGQALAARM